MSGSLNEIGANTVTFPLVSCIARLFIEVRCAFSWLRSVSGSNMRNRDGWLSLSEISNWSAHIESDSEVSEIIAFIDCCATCIV